MIHIHKPFSYVFNSTYFFDNGKELTQIAQSERYCRKCGKVLIEKRVIK
jgi:hypothetical protein